MNKAQNFKDYGFGYLFSLTSIKASKSIKYGYLNGIQYFMHHNSAQEQGVKNMCPWASKECSAWCFGGVKRLSMPNVVNARVNRSLLFLNDKETYLKVLDEEIHYLKRKAKNAGTSDKDFTKLGIYSKYSDVQFCEYTKNPGMVRRYVNGDLPSNLHITLSRSEDNHDFCMEMLATGKINVAIPFYGEHPETFYGYPLINGDDHDLRFLDDGGGKIVALKFKGYENRIKASKERGFIVEANEENSKVEKPVTPVAA
jgi:hypothetical protein